MQRQHRVQAPASFMEPTILEKSKMDAVKELASISMQISEAKNLLFKLQEGETEYLVTRETKALEKIHKVLEDSKELLKQTYENYQEIHQFYGTITEYKEFLFKGHAEFENLLKDFNERNELWDKEMQKREDGFTELKKSFKIQHEEIEAGRDAIKKANEQIANERTKIESERGTIERMIIRFKENRI